MTDECQFLLLNDLLQESAIAIRSSCLAPFKTKFLVNKLYHIEYFTPLRNTKAQS